MDIRILVQDGKHVPEQLSESAARRVLNTRRAERKMEPVFLEGEVRLLDQVEQRHWEGQGHDLEPPEKGPPKGAKRHYVMRLVRKK